MPPLYLTFDLETHLIKKGCTMPRLVCLSWSTGGESGLMNRNDAMGFIKEAFTNPDVILIGHNVAYDLGVIAAEDTTLVPVIFDLYENARVRDTIIRQKLMDIAVGQLRFHYDEELDKVVKNEYTLAHLAKRLLGITLEKEDTWRLKYALLDGVPIDEWPEDAKKYAILDAEVTDAVFYKQSELAGAPIPNSAEQHKAAWALHLMSAWGIRTDGEAVAKLKQSLEEEREKALVHLRTTDILRPGDKKNLKAIRQRVINGYAVKELGPPPMTPKLTGVQTSAEVLLLSGDEDLKVLAEAAKGMKLLDTFVPVLERGTRSPINARYHVLVDTGRTSCSDPNLQNLSRRGGVRECIQARSGMVLCHIDYDTIELRALAQVCLDMLGYSEMAEALRRGEDLHLNLAADLMGISREDARIRYKAGDKEVEDQRQLAKVSNFGAPGGMSAKTFCEYAAGYGLKVELPLSEKLHAQWKRSWPEMKRYFDIISSLTRGPLGDGKVIQVRSGRVRGGVTFTAAANGFFQGLAADGAKEALWAVSKECYAVPESPIYGCRPVLFVHDEIGSEVPYDPKRPELASNAAKHKQKVMIAAMQKWIPDIPITATPVLMKRWYKGAKPVYDAAGNLLPCKPISDGKKTTWVADI